MDCENCDNCELRLRKNTISQLTQFIFLNTVAIAIATQFVFLEGRNLAIAKKLRKFFFMDFLYEFSKNYSTEIILDKNSQFRNFFAIAISQFRN